MRVFDYHEDESWIGFTMEHLDGSNLAAHLQPLAGTPIPRLSPSERLSLVASVAEKLASALDYIHGRGYVHRDIKPSNIMLSGDITDPQVKLLDFDLTSAIQPGGTPRPQPGTVTYMAPEVLAGAQATPASDLFSFGKVLYLDAP